MKYAKPRVTMPPSRRIKIALASMMISFLPLFGA
jgi:hypothetical protein